VVILDVLLKFWQTFGCGLDEQLPFLRILYRIMPPIDGADWTDDLNACRKASGGDAARKPFRCFGTIYGGEDLRVIRHNRVSIRDAPDATFGAEGFNAWSVLFAGRSATYVPRWGTV
jgi:hypothetical protein